MSGRSCDARNCDYAQPLLPAGHTPSSTPEAGRQKLTIALAAMRVANRAAADKQREAQHSEGLTVKARQARRGDQSTQAYDPRTRDKDSER